MKRNDYGTLHKREYLGGLICWLCWQLGFPLLAALAVALLGLQPLSYEGRVWVNLICLSCTAALVAAVFWRYLKEQFARLRGNCIHVLGQLGIGLALWYGLALLFGVLVQVLSLLLQLPFENANNDLVMEHLRASPVPMLLCTVVLTPVVEECLHRGLLFCPLANRSRFCGYAVSMLVFSSMHLLAGIGLPIGVLALGLLQYLPAAFTLAWVYDRTGTIWTSIFLHALINAIACSMSLLA